VRSSAKRIESTSNELARVSVGEHLLIIRFGLMPQFGSQIHKKRIWKLYERQIKEPGFLTTIS
jgi:hypothetical protein